MQIIELGRRDMASIPKGTYDSGGEASMTSSYRPIDHGRHTD